MQPAKSQQTTWPKGIQQYPDLSSSKCESPSNLTKGASENASHSTSGSSTQSQIDLGNESSFPSTHIESSHKPSILSDATLPARMEPLEKTDEAAFHDKRQLFPLFKDFPLHLQLKHTINALKVGLSKKPAGDSGADSTSSSSTPLAAGLGRAPRSRVSTQAKGHSIPDEISYAQFIHDSTHAQVYPPNQAHGLALKHVKYFGEEPPQSAGSTTQTESTPLPYTSQTVGSRVSTSSRGQRTAVYETSTSNFTAVSNLIAATAEGQDAHNSTVHALRVRAAQAVSSYATGRQPGSLVSPSSTGHGDGRMALSSTHSTASPELSDLASAILDPQHRVRSSLPGRLAFTSSREAAQFWLTALGMDDELALYLMLARDPISSHIMAGFHLSQSGADLENWITQSMTPEGSAFRKLRQEGSRDAGSDIRDSLTEKHKSMLRNWLLQAVRDTISQIHTQYQQSEEELNLMGITDPLVNRLRASAMFKKTLGTALVDGTFTDKIIQWFGNGGCPVPESSITSQAAEIMKMSVNRLAGTTQYRRRQDGGRVTTARERKIKRKDQSTKTSQGSNTKMMGGEKNEQSISNKEEVSGSSGPTQQVKPLDLTTLHPTTNLRLLKRTTRLPVPTAGGIASLVSSVNANLPLTQSDQSSVQTSSPPNALQAMISPGQAIFDPHAPLPENADDYQKIAQTIDKVGQAFNNLTPSNGAQFGRDGPVAGRNSSDKDYEVRADKEDFAHLKEYLESTKDLSIEAVHASMEAQAARRELMWREWDRRTGHNLKTGGNGGDVPTASMIKHLTGVLHASQRDKDQSSSAHIGSEEKGSGQENSVKFEKSTALFRSIANPPPEGRGDETISPGDGLPDVQTMEAGDSASVRKSMYEEAAETFPLKPKELLDGPIESGFGDGSAKLSISATHKDQSSAYHPETNLMKQTSAFLPTSESTEKAPSRSDVFEHYRKTHVDKSESEGNDFDEAALTSRTRRLNRGWAGDHEKEGAVLGAAARASVDEGSDTSDEERQSSLRMFNDDLDGLTFGDANTDALDDDTASGGFFPTFTGIRDFSTLNNYLKFAPSQVAHNLDHGRLTLTPLLTVLELTPWSVPLKRSIPTDLHKELIFIDGFDYDYVTHKDFDINSAGAVPIRAFLQDMTTAEDYYFLSDSPMTSVTYKPNDAYPFLVSEGTGTVVPKEKGQKAAASPPQPPPPSAPTTNQSRPPEKQSAQTLQQNGTQPNAPATAQTQQTSEEKKRGRPKIPANYKHSFVYQMSTALTSVFRQVLSIAIHEERSPDSGRTDTSADSEKSDASRRSDTPIDHQQLISSTSQSRALNKKSRLSSDGSGDESMSDSSTDGDTKDHKAAHPTIIRPMPGGLVRVRRKIRKPKHRAHRRDPVLGVLEELDEEEDTIRPGVGAKWYGLDELDNDEVHDVLDELSWEEDEDEDLEVDDPDALDDSTGLLLVPQSGEREGGRSGDDEVSTDEGSDEDEEDEDEELEGDDDTGGGGRKRGGKTRKSRLESGKRRTRRHPGQKKRKGKGTNKLGDKDYVNGDDVEDSEAIAGDASASDSDEYSEEGERKAALASGDAEQYQLLLEAKEERDRRRERRRQRRLERQRRQDEADGLPMVVQTGELPKYYGVVTPWISSLPKTQPQSKLDDIDTLSLHDGDENESDSDYDVLTPVRKTAPWLTSGITPGEYQETFDWRTGEPTLIRPEGALPRSAVYSDDGTEALDAFLSSTLASSPSSLSLLDTGSGTDRRNNLPPEVVQDFRSSLQTRVEQLWEYFRTPVQSRLDFLAKYMQKQHAPALNHVLALWEHCGASIAVRESLLNQLRLLEKGACESQHNKMTTSEALLLSRTRHQIHNHLIRVSHAVKRAILAMYVLHDEQVIFMSDLYTIRMRRDYRSYEVSVRNENTLREMIASRTPSHDLLADSSKADSQVAGAKFRALFPVPLRSWALALPGDSDFDTEENFVRDLLLDTFDRSGQVRRALERIASRTPVLNSSEPGQLPEARDGGGGSGDGENTYLDGMEPRLASMYNWICDKALQLIDRHLKLGGPRTKGMMNVGDPTPLNERGDVVGMPPLRRVHRKEPLSITQLDMSLVKSERVRDIDGNVDAERNSVTAILKEAIGASDFDKYAQKGQDGDDGGNGKETARTDQHKEVDNQCDGPPQVEYILPVAPGKDVLADHLAKSATLRYVADVRNNVNMTLLAMKLASTGQSILDHGKLRILARYHTPTSASSNSSTSSKPVVPSTFTRGHFKPLIPGWYLPIGPPHPVPQNDNHTVVLGMEDQLKLASLVTDQWERERRRRAGIKHLLNNIDHILGHESIAQLEAAVPAHIYQRESTTSMEQESSNSTSMDGSRVEQLKGGEKVIKPIPAYLTDVMTTQQVQSTVIQQRAISLMSDATNVGTAMGYGSKLELKQMGALHEDTPSSTTLPSVSGPDNKKSVYTKATGEEEGSVMSKVTAILSNPGSKKDFTYPPSLATYAPIRSQSKETSPTAETSTFTGSYTGKLVPLNRQSTNNRPSDDQTNTRRITSATVNQNRSVTASIYQQKPPSSAPTAPIPSQSTRFFVRPRIGPSVGVIGALSGDTAASSPRPAIVPSSTQRAATSYGHGSGYTGRGIPGQLASTTTALPHTRTRRASTANKIIPERSSTSTLNQESNMASSSGSAESDMSLAKLASLAMLKNMK